MKSNKEHFTDQLNKVYWAFFENPKTMKEADKFTGVMRENICRYCRTLRLQGKLYKVCKRVCAVTKHKAIAWTTNPDLIPPSNQLKLF
ncbi:MAG: hypothetical protein IPO70_06810 [Bacteroidetes bacterium]|nr:hypothetical protein [Bacteroidota bacterium]